MNNPQGHAVDIVIVGAGLIGSSLALLLANQTNFRIAVIDRSSALQPPSDPNKRVVALGEAAKTILQTVGVFEHLGQEYCYPYDRMFVWEQLSHGELEFSINDLPVHNSTQHLGHMVDSEMCQYQLHTKLASQTQIIQYFGAQPHNLHSKNQRSVLSFTDQEGDIQEISASLIVAADGAHSWIRQQAGIFSNHHAYQQQGIVARVRSSQRHQDTAWQCFLETGPIAMLPLIENQSSIVWSADNDYAEELMNLSELKFNHALSNALGGRLGKIELTSSRQSFPLRSQRAAQYFAKNVVLVGDAAHSIHPLAGQGANLGFKDILCLVRLLSSSSTTDIYHPALLKAYQRQRKADNELTDTLMSSLFRAYQRQTGLLSGLRSWGMNRLNNHSIVKRMLVKQAVGYS